MSRFPQWKEVSQPMSFDRTEGIEHRLRAYILPRKPVTSEQIEAFDLAVEAQLAYETDSGLEDVPNAVTEFSLGDFSATLAEDARYPAYTRQTISPVAWSILRNAGLIVYSLPTARKP